MNKEFLISIVINLIITAFFYMILPFIAFCRKEKFTKKELIQVVVANSLLIYTIFFTIYFFLNINQIPKIYPSFFYGIINYYMLKKNIDNSVENKKSKKKNKIENKYIQILKNKKCSRKIFWTYYGIMWLIFIMIVIIYFIFKYYYKYGFNESFFLTFSGLVILTLSSICFLLQIKRLRDANLSPWLMLLYLLSFLGEGFRWIVFLLMLIFLCLPSQLKYTNEKRES